MRFKVIHVQHSNAGGLQERHFVWLLGMFSEIVGSTESLRVGKFHRRSIVIVVFTNARFAVPPTLVVQLAGFRIRDAIVVTNPPDLRHHHKHQDQNNLHSE